MTRTRSLAVAAIVFVVAGCATYKNELVRSQQAFDGGQHERALALLQDLEPDLSRLTNGERAQYAYLRGMSDYRLGRREPARHWLAIASAYEETSPGVLPTDWKARTNSALDEMNEVVQADGYAALATSSRRPAEVGENDATKASAK